MKPISTSTSTRFAPAGKSPSLIDFPRHGPTPVPGTRIASVSVRCAARNHACGERSTVIVKIVPNDKNTPPGKLADAELHFTDGVLEGLKLLGFAVWERRVGGGRNVTFPARQFSVNGERRSFSLLRPIADASAQDRIRELVLQAYSDHEERAAIPS